MPKFIVARQKSVAWYEIEIEAKNKEEALSKAKHPAVINSNKWEQDIVRDEKWVVTEIEED